MFNEAEALAALHQCKGNLEEAQKCIVDNIIEHSDWSKANFQQTLRDKAVDRRVLFISHYLSIFSQILPALLSLRFQLKST